MGKSGLTEEQLLVAKNREGYTATIACPGSGKSTTMAERCKMLPRNESKVVLAFNKEAKESFEKKVKGVPNCKVQTFHAFCLAQVMKDYKVYGFSAKPEIDTHSTLCHLVITANEIKARGWDEAKLDKDLAQHTEIHMYDAELDQAIEELNVDQLLEVKEMLLVQARGGDSKALDAQAELCRIENELARYRTLNAMRRFREYLIENNVVTFSAMIRLVAQNRGKLQFWADHLMVDEFQDVDRFQFDIIKRIGDSGRLISLAVVGDPQQRIYEWRGALEDGFVDYINHFNAESFQLSWNFRSSPEIVSFAEARLPVGMKASRKSAGFNVMQISAESYVDTLKRFFNGNIPNDLSKTAVIARYNRTCFQWQLEMARADLPVYMMGGGDFWNQAHVKIIMQGRKDGMKMEELTNCDAWLKLITKRQYANNEERLAEILADASWLLLAPESDIVLLKKNLQRPECGLRISTAHKTKGLEFENVIVSNVDQKFFDDSFVYYVAITRAQDRLAIHTDPRAQKQATFSRPEQKMPPPFDEEEHEPIWPDTSEEDIPNRS